MKCRDYYWLFINSSKIEPSGIKKWENDPNLVDFNWKLAFSRIRKTCKETKLREFCYKLLHRITAIPKRNCIDMVLNQTANNAYTVTNLILYYTPTWNAKPQRHCLIFFLTWFNNSSNSRYRYLLSKSEWLFRIMDSVDI